MTQSLTKWRRYWQIRVFSNSPLDFLLCCVSSVEHWSSLTARCLWTSHFSLSLTITAACSTHKTAGGDFNLFIHSPFILASVWCNVSHHCSSFSCVSTSPTVPIWSLTFFLPLLYCLQPSLSSHRSVLTRPSYSPFCWEPTTACHYH